MPIDTGISGSLRKPQVFHKFSWLMGGRSLVNLPQRAVFIETAESVREGLERLVFRMHRKKLAEERSAAR